MGEDFSLISGKKIYNKETQEETEEKIKVSNAFKPRATTTKMIMTTKHMKIRETFVTEKDKNKDDNSILYTTREKTQ